MQLKVKDNLKTLLAAGCFEDGDFQLIPHILITYFCQVHL